MAKRTCSIEGCERSHFGRGWCQKHYFRWRNRGDAKAGRRSAVERFWLKVDTQGEGGCWLWTAGLSGRGYSQLHVEGREVLGHRFAYELLVGPIPDDLQLDHLCRVRHCVNPDHLEPVTGRENTLRGESPSAKNAKATHCPQGHPYSGDNLYMLHGLRLCRACRAARSKRRNARKTLTSQSEGTTT